MTQPLHFGHAGNTFLYRFAASRHNFDFNPREGENSVRKRKKEETKKRSPVESIRIRRFDRSQRYTKSTYETPLGYSLFYASSRRDFVDCRRTLSLVGNATFWRLGFVPAAGGRGKSTRLRNTERRRWKMREKRGRETKPSKTRLAADGVDIRAPVRATACHSTVDFPSVRPYNADVTLSVPHLRRHNVGDTR